mgnify:CR=1 FL=1
MIRLGRIDHVCLRVRDLDEAAARWCLQFGLVERSRESGRALAPGALLREASRVCREHADGESLFMLYARIAPLAWPWRPGDPATSASRSDADAA